MLSNPVVADRTELFNVDRTLGEAEYRQRDDDSQHHSNSYPEHSAPRVQRVERSFRQRHEARRGNILGLQLHPGIPMLRPDP
jgi:hypothetical protein